jgi:type IV secretion system protein VirB10
MRLSKLATALVAASGLTISLYAIDRDRDFSGKWVLDNAASEVRALGQVESALTVSESDAAMLCSAGPVGWSYALDGGETKTRVGDEQWNSVTKWEGAALLVNVLVSGPRAYTVMDRWTLSGDRATLTISRQIVLPNRQAEGQLVFRREAERPAADILPPADTAPPAQALAKRAGPAAAVDVTVPKGTHVLLALVSEVSTKHAKEGDRVYLRTDAPVAAGGRVVIPRWSDVSGTITRTKPAGRVAGKGELYLRFDSLILPNGVSRDFHARPTGEEGKVAGNGKSADGRTVMEGAGMGATVGAITRGLPGAAVGGVAGAVAGVLLSRDQDVVLRPGTHLEMVLDRDLVFHPEELQGGR